MFALKKPLGAGMGKCEDGHALVVMNEGYRSQWPVTDIVEVER